MSLYEKWLKGAYDSKGKAVNAFWNSYMPKEQAIYEDIIGNKNNEIKGTVASLGERYHMQPAEICGFIDGINGGIQEHIDVEALEEDTEVTLKVDFEALYKKMVEYKAKHLYELPQWDNIFTEGQRKVMFIEQKKSGTIVKEEKTGRNDPCPCNSGKKYKKCCGAK